MKIIAYLVVVVVGRRGGGVALGLHKTNKSAPVFFNLVISPVISQCRLTGLQPASAMHRAHHVASACFSPRSQPTSSFTAREKPEGTNQPRRTSLTDFSSFSPLKSDIYLLNVRLIVFVFVVVVFFAPLSSTDLIIIMRKITGKHLLCFFLLALPMSWAEDTKKDVRKRENVTGKDRWARTPSPGSTHAKALITAGFISALLMHSIGLQSLWGEGGYMSHICHIL